MYTRQLACDTWICYFKSVTERRIDLVHTTQCSR